MHWRGVALGWVLVTLGCGSPAPRPALMDADAMERGDVLISRPWSQRIPWENPVDACWESAPLLKLDLTPQQDQEPKLMTPTVGRLRVRSLHAGGWIAFLLEWDDPTHSIRYRSDRFGDAAAVEFPLKLDPLPEYKMGGEGKPVHLLFWSSIRQRAVEEKMPFFQENYPNAWTDAYAFEPRVPGHRPGEATKSERDKYLAARAAGNPSRLGAAPPVEELTAETWNRLTVQTSQSGRGRGVWKNGVWRVVIARPVVTADPEDAQLGGIREWKVAFAVWDGGKENQGPRKMVTKDWISLRIER